MAVPTIDDVAAAAGVSKSTVSRVLNGDYTYIREKTLQRVQQAILDLGYRPSSVARSLTSKRTQTIGMLISDVGNPFYADVIHGVEDVAILERYNTFLGNTNYDLKRGTALVQSFIDRRVDGMLIMSSSMAVDWLEELSHNRVPVVVVDWESAAEAAGKDAGETAAENEPHSPSANPTVNAIGVDFKTGIQAAVEHLTGLGHRDFAYASGPLHLRTARDRRDAFLQALLTQEINPRQVPVIESSLQIEGGRQAMRLIAALSTMPTAVMAANDLMAIGIIEAAHGMGIQVPADLSVVGLDDIWLAAQIDPPLTTVALPRYAIGTLAAKMLFALLGKPETQSTEPVHNWVKTSLVVRESTGAVRNDRIIRGTGTGGLG